MPDQRDGKWAPTNDNLVETAMMSALGLLVSIVALNMGWPV
jgi:hypothetical protein